MMARIEQWGGPEFAWSIPDDLDSVLFHNMKTTSIFRVLDIVTDMPVVRSGEAIWIRPETVEFASVKSPNLIRHIQKEGK